MYMKFWSLDKAHRDDVAAKWTAWNDAYIAYKPDEPDATKKAAALKKVKDAEKAFNDAFGTSGGSSSTAFIVIGVVLVLAAAVGGGLWYKNKQGKNNAEGGEADDRKLYKSQIASVNAHKKAQKVALVDADV